MVTGRALFVAALLSGCAATAETARTSEDIRRRAAAQERSSCDAQVIAADGVLLTPDNIKRVTPYTVLVSSSGTTPPQYRLRGATLYIPAQPEITKEYLERVLLCHQARRVLGEIAPSQLRDDPFWIPNGWLTIDVQSDRGGFAVRLGTNDVHQANAVLARANEYEHSAARSTQ